MTPRAVQMEPLPLVPPSLDTLGPPGNPEVVSNEGRITHNSLGGMSEYSSDSPMTLSVTSSYKGM